MHTENVGASEIFAEKESFSFEIHYIDNLLHTTCRCKLPQLSVKSVKYSHLSYQLGTSKSQFLELIWHKLFDCKKKSEKHQNAPKSQNLAQKRANLVTLIDKWTYLHFSQYHAPFPLNLAFSERRVLYDV